MRCRKLVSAYPQLSHFEVCVLANLAPGDVEEAKLMVPSLVVSSMLIALCIPPKADNKYSTDRSQS